MRVVVALTVLAACDFTGNGHVDAAPMEDAAAPFDPAQECPPPYDRIDALASRYRLDPVAQPAWSADADCNDDLPGKTHLVALDDMAEVIAVQKVVDATSGSPQRFWVGGVQRLDATTIGGSWLSITGGAMIATAWAPNEPSDDDYTTEHHVEQFVRLERSLQFLVDAPGSTPEHGFICECDGKPVDAEAEQAVEDSTP